MKTLAILLVVALAILAGDVSAQEDTPAARRSLATARRFSAFGMIVPSGAGVGLIALGAEGNATVAALIGAPLCAFGVLAGPGLGHAYAGDSGRLGRGMWTRLGGIAIAGLGAGMIVAGSGGFDLMGSGRRPQPDCYHWRSSDLRRRACGLRPECRP